MALYLVVHHREDTHQTYANNWLDDSRLETITTTEKVSILCKAAKENGETVYIHRCSYGSYNAIICCKLKVKRIEKLSKNSYLVDFIDLILLNESPPYQPHLGQNCYEI